MKIVQIVPCFSYGDAVGNDMMAMNRILEDNGYDTEIYALEIDKRLVEYAVPYTDMPELSDDDVLIYHMATACDMTEDLKKQRCMKIMRYHNITPPHFFVGYNAGAVYACQEGLRQVKGLYADWDYCLADSDFNKSELISYGYSCPVKMLPVIIPFEDYRREPDTAIYSRYKDGKTNILFVGRIVPNKKQEDIIEAFYYYKKYWNGNARLLLAGKYDENDSYYKRLVNYVNALGVEDVVFTGHIGFAGLLACYKAADLFLCLSEHEGFCVPVVEAMYFDIPVIAYGTCAVPETMGAGTMVMKEKKPKEIAAMIDYVLTHEECRESLLAAQREKLNDFSYEKIETRFLDIIEKIRKGKHYDLL